MTISEANAKRNEAVNAIIALLWQFDEEDTRFMVLAIAWSTLLKAHHRDPTDEAGRMWAIHQLLSEGKYSDAETISKLKKQIVSKLKKEAITNFKKKRRTRK